MPDSSPAGELSREHAAREKELAEQRRVLRQMNAQLNKDIAVGGAAVADPGNAWAAQSALDGFRVISSHWRWAATSGSRLCLLGFVGRRRVERIARR